MSSAHHYLGVLFMYDYIRIRLQGMIKSERGASAVEYGLLVALIAVAIILTVKGLGSKLNTTFQNVNANMP